MSSGSDSPFVSVDGVPIPEFALPPGPFAADWESLKGYRIPGWFEDAKFGIFLHWGVYGVPAFGNEWYPRNMYQPDSKEHAHHVATYGPVSESGYKDFIPRFTAGRFDPDAWAELFAASGAKYVVPVAEHHDGFPLYDSAYTSWNAVRRGPKRDLIAALEKSVRARGLRFGASSHRAENCWFFHTPLADADVYDPANRGLYGFAQPKEQDAPAAHLEEWLARCCEIVDKFRPEVVWFDWWIEEPEFEPYLRKFAAYYYNRAAQWGIEPVIQYKYESFPEEAAVLDIERGQLSDIRPRFWQTDTSVSTNSWGYIEGHRYRTATALLHDLIDIVSKNGSLLLNLGPRPDGTIPDEEQALLREIGAWLAVHGEAVYGTRNWKVYGEGPTQVEGGAFKDATRQPFAAGDVRYTAKDDFLYAHLLALPEDGVARLKSLGSDLRLLNRPVEEVTLLGGDIGGLPFAREPDALAVTLPEGTPPTPHAHVLRLRLAPGVKETGR